jgi:hypothetical protein
MAGDGLIILPTVITTLATNKLLIDAKAFRNVMLLPVTEQLKLLTDTESSVILWEFGFLLWGKRIGNVRMTEAFDAT